MENTKLTSVKLLENLYGDFKKNTVNSTMTLQKLKPESKFPPIAEKSIEEAFTRDSISVNAPLAAAAQDGAVDAAAAVSVSPAGTPGYASCCKWAPSE